MFGLKNAAAGTNQKKLVTYFLPGEELEFFSQLSHAYIGVTNKGRVFANEIEKPTALDGTLYVFNINQITGLIMYHKKATLIAGEGVGLMLGAKEIILFASDKKECQQVFLYFQKYVWK